MARQRIANPYYAGSSPVTNSSFRIDSANIKAKLWLSSDKNYPVDFWRS